MDELTKQLISKSQVSTYSYCPMQYKFRYVDGIKSETNPTLAIGSRIHEFYDKFFEVAKEVAPEDWYGLIHPGFSPYEQKMIRCFMDYEWSRLKKFNNNYDLWMPIMRETMVVNEELGLRGIIDRVDKVNDEYIIVEYKTSKSIYKPSLQKEFGFYKYLLNHTPPYDEWNITLGRVINPRLCQVEYMAPSKESTIVKVLKNLRESKRTGNFERTCSEGKYPYCQLCSLDDCGMYDRNVELFPDGFF